MFINDMLFKTIPRSLRAGVALVVMLICLQQAFTSLQSLIVPSEAGVTAWMIVKLGVALLIGIAAAIAFYYFQDVDSQTKTEKPDEAGDKPATPPAA